MQPSAAVEIEEAIRRARREIAGDLPRCDAASIKLGIQATPV
jgi:hypothetical protein